MASNKSPTVSDQALSCLGSTEDGIVEINREELDEGASKTVGFEQEEPSLIPGTRIDLVAAMDPVVPGIDRLLFGKEKGKPSKIKVCSLLCIPMVL